MLKDQQIITKYGQPGDEANMVVIKFPYPMRIAWDLTKTVTTTRCHKLAADRFTAVFNDLLAHYGLNELQRLGIDLFGGLVNFRLQRGSKTKWSRHAWGIAIDLDPARNGLKTKWKDAQFAKPEYKAMVDIFHKHGFIGYGPDRNYDAMHWELAD
jgi:D-alanyl-D-alanine carboxypeptidase